MSISKTPVFNLKVALNQTGLTADTLRAWERRYGLPLPQRTAGGHRLYSQYDIETIKWLIAQQAEGFSISRAVDKWNEQTASGTDPLAAAATQTLSAPGTSLNSLRTHWLDACLHFDAATAEQALGQAFAMFSVEDVCVEVLQKGLSEIGTQWYENKASVQQEHFASALAMRRIESLLSACPAPTRQQTIVVGCPPNEWHTFTPLLISLFLRRRGWNVIYLGANVPAMHLQEMFASVHADLVVLVAQQLTTSATLMQTSHMLNAQKIRVAFGGRIFNIQPALVRRMAGSFLGESVDASISEIESLVTKAGKNPKAEAIPEEYVTASLSFQSYRAQIEALLNQTIGSINYETGAMKTATEFLGDNIIAALQLGDMSLIDSEIGWVRSLLKANSIPEQALNDYLKLYANAVNGNINGAGKPVMEWLNIQTTGNK